MRKYLEATAEAIRRVMIAFAIAITGHNLAAVFHQFCQISGFTARGGARVQDAFVRLRIKKMARHGCARVLYVALTPRQRATWNAGQADKTIVLGQDKTAGMGE